MEIGRQIGTTDPQYVALRTNVDLMVSALSVMHFGARGNYQWLSDFRDNVNVGRLTAFPAGSEVTPDSLREARFINGDQVKILGSGNLGHALTVKAHAFSKSARERIEAAGGRVEVIGA